MQPRMGGDGTHEDHRPSYLALLHHRQPLSLDRSSRCCCRRQMAVIAHESLATHQGPIAGSLFVVSAMSATALRSVPVRTVSIPGSPQSRACVLVTLVLAFRTLVGYATFDATVAAVVAAVETPSSRNMLSQMAQSFRKVSLLRHPAADAFAGSLSHAPLIR